MHKIGAFSQISKTPVKTLRYYEKEQLLLPAFVDQTTGYRYYETRQLLDLANIITYRQIGMSILDIKDILHGKQRTDVLKKRKQQIEDSLTLYQDYLLKIQYLLEEKNMDSKIVVKEIPEMIVYFKEGVIEKYAELASFVLTSGAECLQLNPDLKCADPDYCFVTYLDGEYKEEDIKVRYAQAVTAFGKESDQIKFMKIPAIKAVCIYHKGSYSNLRDSYTKIQNYLDENGYHIAAPIRECYIDGCWNKECEEDYFTEIQVPVIR